MRLVIVDRINNCINNYKTNIYIYIYI